MRRCSSTRGFTTVELMVTVLILGILVFMAIPMFMSTRATAERRTCYANQRALEGAANTWEGASPDNRIADLAGIVDAAHPLVIDGILGGAPRCPAAPKPADSDNPTSAEGAYTMNGAGTVALCTFGHLGPHGHY